MKIYEIRVTAHRVVCVKATSEEDALDFAEEELIGSEWSIDDCYMEDELNPEEPSTLSWIKECKRDGNYFESES